MDAFLIEVVEPLFLSAWVFPITVLFVALDGALPLVPGEGVVITAAVLADGDAVQIAALAGAATVGSLLGDTASYGVGRFLGTRVSDRLFRTGKRAEAHRWATEKLHRSGGAILIAARFLPGGRTATTLAAGTLRFPFRRFLPYASIAAVAWACYTTALGVVAGGAFVNRPFASVLLGLGLGVGLSMFLELVRRLVNATRAARARAAAEVGPGTEAVPAAGAVSESANAAVTESEAVPATESASQRDADDVGGNTGRTDGASRPILLESAPEEPD